MTHEELRHAKSYANDTLSHMHTQNKSTAAGYTAGPWTVDDRHVHCKAGLTYPRGVEPETDVIVQVDTDCHSRGLLNETDQANLRLIAAAPELLEALVELLEHEGQRVVNGIGLEEDSDELRAVKEQARAAIARARGVQS